MLLSAELSRQHSRHFDPTVCCWGLSPPAALAVKLEPIFVAGAPGRHPWARTRRRESIARASRPFGSFDLAFVGSSRKGNA